jgi:carbonic anhydrase/acetyltransferase-like protein (isoleucine patch superfamily)
MTGGQGDRVAVGLGGAFDIRGGEIGILIANSSGVISGGTIGDQSRIRLGAVEMSGGTIGNGLAVEFDALLSMSGDAHIGNGFTLRADLDMRSGTIGDNFFIDGGDARIVGGSVGNNTIVRDGALTLDTQPGRTAPTIGSIAVQAGGNLQIEAGSGDDRVAVFPGGSLHVAGGVLAGPFVALPAATFDLTVLDATLAGIPLDLPLFEPTVINERDGLLLELVLADGSPLELTLNPSPLQDGSDYIHPNATLRLTRVPTPSATLPLALAAIAVRRRRR